MSDTVPDADPNRPVSRLRSRLVWVILAALLLGAGAFRLLVGNPLAAPTWEEGLRDEARRRAEEVYAGESAVAKTMFTRMGEPKPGEWLHRVAEPGQTLREYAAQWHNKRTAERHTVYVLPAGEFSDAELNQVAEMARYAAIFCVRDVELLPLELMPKAAYTAERKQYDTDALLEWLKPRLPADGLVLLGVTAEDIYHSGVDFIYGVGSRSGRVGFCSINRYDAAGPMYVRRTLTLISHELCHAFTMPHCIFYACQMNGTATLAEQDRTPVHLCPVCHAKLQKAIGFDPHARFAALASYYDRIGFHTDAAFVRKRATLTPASQPNCMTLRDCGTHGNELRP